MNKYTLLTKDLIKQSGYEVTFDNDGTPHVISHKRKNPVEMKFTTRVGKQRYSTNNKPYLYVMLSLKGRRDTAYALSRVVWAWCKKECPVDMTVDHKDNKHSTPFDNRLKNLQLLSHAENLSKKHTPRNQWSWMLTDEQMEDYRSLKDAEEELKGIIVSCKEEIEDLKEMGRRLKGAVSIIRTYPADFLNGLHWEDGHASWEDEGMFQNDAWSDISKRISSWAEDVVDEEDWRGTEKLLSMMKGYLWAFEARILEIKDEIRNTRIDLAMVREDIDNYVKRAREEYYRKNS